MLYKVSQQEIDELAEKIKLGGKDFINDYSEIVFTELSSDYLENIDNTRNSIDKLYVINKMIDKGDIEIVIKNGKKTLIDK